MVWSLALCPDNAKRDPRWRAVQETRPLVNKVKDTHTLSIIDPLIINTLAWEDQREWRHRMTRMTGRTAMRSKLCIIK